MADETRLATATAAAEESKTPTAAAAATGGSKKNQQRGFLSRTWKRLLGGEDDFEKRLQHLSKEESLVHTRMRNRARTSRKMSTYIIVFFLLSEVVAVVYAIMKTRSLELDWQTRALNVLPMFLIPAVAFIVYSTFLKYIRMRDRKDQKTLEKLRAERQAKIDELKERTNYYTTQQLIQKYDLDPAAKAAAATVLASKLGAETGLKVYLGDDNKVDASGRSNDVQLGQSNTGLRNRKQSQHMSHSAGSSGSPSYIEGIPSEYVADSREANVYDQSREANVYDQRMVEHYKGVALHDGGWLARIAALLVGEDPTQCYALICGNCHMHNGLARKEDFPYITYYCPHCHALNGSRIPEEQVSPSSSVVLTPVPPGEVVISPTASNTSSVTGSDAKSNFATVEELPVVDGDDNKPAVDGDDNKPAVDGDDNTPAVDGDDNKEHDGNTK